MGEFFRKCVKFHLKDRFVALVGLGDHITYPKNFVDGMGYMAELVSGLGATLVGKNFDRRLRVRGFDCRGG